MDINDLEKLRYPIGHFVVHEPVTKILIDDWIAQLEALPVNLEDLVSDLTEVQLDTPYRPEGWTVRQVVHHLADSHHHSYIRFKWALTEDRPEIKAYEEKAWANLFDAKTAPIGLSLNHLKAVHAKLVYLLRGLTEEDLEKTFVHPEDKAEVSIKENIGKYAWHGCHHLAHIERLMHREGWLACP